MSRCCGNCFWSFTPYDEEELEGYSEDDLNRPQAGDCCLGREHDENFCCSEHSYIDGMEEYNTYVLYDDKYLGPGYLIISELDGEVIKFMKISVSGDSGFPSFSIRAYEKDSLDTVDQQFRDVTFTVGCDEPLYGVFYDLLIGLNGNFIVSVDPVNQGKGHLYTTMFGKSEASLIVSKDVYGAKNSTDFVDILVGDNDSCSLYSQVTKFYNDLSTIAVGKTKDEDIKKLLLK